MSPANRAHPSDAELVQRTWSGDKEAYGDLVTRYQGHVYGLAYSLVGNWADAQDIAQETFIRAYCNLDQVRDPARFAAWLRRIAFSVSVNWLKAFRPRIFERLGSPEDMDALDIPDFAPDPSEVAEKRELADAVLGAVASLPPKYRVPLTMFHLDGLSYRKVADFLDIPLGTAKSLIHRAREKLKPALSAFAMEEVGIMVKEVFEEHKLPAEFARKVLENLKWTPRWVSHMGCIKGCLDYLNIDVSPAWLYGATGHAFVLNIHEVVCPSGPTAWNADKIFKLGQNLGYTIEVLSGHRADKDFAEKQQTAWEKARRAIDEGLPCFGWELDDAEYYVIYGYDDKGYFISGPGCDSGKGPKLWQQLADTQIGWLQLCVLRPGKPAEDKKTVGEALQFALAHAQGHPERLFPKYKSGLGGYDQWANALETGKAIGHGMAYNAAVWSECRAHAVGFLKEAKRRIGGKTTPLFDEAVGHYDAVAQDLKAVAEAFPWAPEEWDQHVKDEARCQTAISHLKHARKAEEAGLESLEKIVNALKP